MYTDILLTLLIAGLIVVVIVYVRHIRRTPDREAIELWAIQFVRAAEQLFPPGDNVTKLTYCMDMIERIFPRVDTELLRSVIEYAVFRLRDETNAGIAT